MYCRPGVSGGSAPAEGLLLVLFSLWEHPSQPSVLVLRSPPSIRPVSPGRLASRPQAQPPATLEGPRCTVGTQMAGSRGVWAVLLTGSPPVPQLMRMVLCEALKALQMQGWDERWVLVLFTPIAGWSVSLQTERVCVSWLTSDLPGNWQPGRVLQWGWAGLCWS